MNLIIDQIHMALVYIERDDYVVCVTIAEKTNGPTYAHRGGLLAPEGTPYRRSQGLLMRLYPNGWGAGVYRRKSAQLTLMIHGSDHNCRLTPALDHCGADLPTSP